MKKILLSLAVLVMMTASCYCQEEPLILTVSSHKKAYKANEDIKIKLEITNISQYPVIINTRGEAFKIEIKRPRGDIITPKKMIMLKIGPPKEKDFIKLNSNENWDSDFIAISPYKEGGSDYEYLDGCYDLTDIGEYAIKAQYTNHYLENYNYETGERKKVDAWTGTLTSNAITVEIIDKLITENQARELARKACVGKLEIPTDAPVVVELTNQVYVVTFNTQWPKGMLGGDYYARVSIDAVSGEVLEILGSD